MVTGGTSPPASSPWSATSPRRRSPGCASTRSSWASAASTSNPGCTEYSLEDARVKRAALASVRRCIVVADSSKLGSVTFAQVCSLERVDVVVTDTGAAHEDIAALEAEHVEVVVDLMGRIGELFEEKKPLIAMAHLRPLPGTPLYDEKEALPAIVEHLRATWTCSWRRISMPCCSATRAT